MYKTFFLSAVLFMVNCQAIDYQSVKLESKQIISDITSNWKTIPTQSGEETLSDDFFSDKLDLVFVLDTSLEMRNFYTENRFGKKFLDRFQKYDWRVAYTDTSIDKSIFGNEEAEESDKNSCKLSSGIISTALGIGFENPFFLSLGIQELVSCFLNLDISLGGEKENKEFSDGSFLNFEYFGREFEPCYLNKNEPCYLNKTSEDYNTVFDHTLKLGNDKNKDKAFEASQLNRRGSHSSLKLRNGKNKGKDFEAPQLKKQESYPFLAMIFSLAKGLTSQDKFNSRFFRKDSLIVYVIVTVNDTKVSSVGNQFQQELQSFGIDKRIKMIPVAITSDSSSFLCPNFGGKIPPNKTPATNLTQLANQFGNKAFNICSAPTKLADDLFKEISKFLRTTEISKLR